MKSFRAAVKSLFHKFGYEVSMYRPANIGESPLSDIEKLIHKTRPQIVFDVGANIGQTIEAFRDMLPESVIYSFEPGTTAFETLKNHHGSRNNVYLNKLGVGSKSETKVFLENSLPDMSSFLPLGRDGWGKIVNEVPVEIVALDDFCEKQKIEYISMLKIDTQGFDFEVLKGAKKLITENRVQLLLVEVTFAELYQGLPPFDEIYRFLTDHNFKLVSFYEIHYKNNLACWTDSLFINPDFIHKQ